jgi:hypothetical protein
MSGAVTEAGCLRVSVDVDAAAYAWGRLDIIIYSFELLNIQSSRLTLFDSIGQINLITIPCISIVDAGTSNCPFAIERAVATTMTAVFSLMGTDGNQLAGLIIDRNSDPTYNNRIPSASNFAASTWMVRAESDGQPQASKDSAQNPGKSVSTKVKLTPKGTQLGSRSARVIFRVLGEAAKKNRRAVSGVAYCQTQLQVMTQANDASPWVPLTTPSLNCSGCPHCPVCCAVNE